MKTKILLFLLVLISSMGYAQIDPLDHTAPDADNLKQAAVKINANEAYLDSRIDTVVAEVDTVGTRLDSLITAGIGGGEVTASNGLTTIDNDIQLGGTITQGIIIGANEAGAIGGLTFDLNDGIFDGGWLKTDFRGVEMGYKLVGDPNITYGFKINGTMTPPIKVVGGQPMFYETDMTSAIIAASNDAIPDKDYVLTSKTYTGKQIFPGSGTGFSAAAGINISRVGDPGTAAISNGDVWYNSTSNLLKARINGVTSTIATGGLTTAGSGLTNTAGTVSLGGSVTGDVTFTPSIDASRNFLVGSNAGNAFQAIYFRSSLQEIHFLTNSSSYFQIQGMSAGQTPLTVSANAALTITSDNSGLDVVDNNNTNDYLGFQTSLGFTTSTGTSGVNLSQLTVLRNQSKLLVNGRQYWDFDGTELGEVKTVLSGSATLDFPSTSVGTTQSLAITVNGAEVGDPVSLGTPTAAITGAIIYMAYVSATNTVTIRALNGGGSATDPGSGIFKVTVHKQ